MKKKSKILGIRRDWNDNFRIPACSECGEDLVKFRGKWLCRDCMKITVKFPLEKPEEVSFRVLYPNREARRKKNDS